MELQVIGKKLIAEPAAHTLVQGENGADTFYIRLPKKYGETDLSKFSFKMRAASEKNTIAEQLLESSYDGNDIMLKWNATSDFTAVAGTLSLELVGVSSNGEIIKIPSSEIYVKASLTGEYSPPQNLIEQALAQMQTLAARAAAEADRARSYIGKSAYDIWLSKGNTGSEEDFLNSLKGQKGDAGTGLKILGTLDSLNALLLAYPNGSSLDGGFMVLGEYYYWDTIQSSWKSAGSLQGAKGDKGDKGDTGDSGKAVIVTDLTSASKTITVADNTEYHFGSLSSLSVNFPNEFYSAFICFTSPSVATSVSFPQGTKIFGQDVTDGVFYPCANKRYSLGLWYDGLCNTVVVGGY
ncbi:MAG: hypothetical protein N2Z57_00220 [Oscillospiraceae bacterium]|nr:hypothetical protein [Oscillospiraceae bacterium]